MNTMTARSERVGAQPTESFGILARFMCGATATKPPRPRCAPASSSYPWRKPPPSARLAASSVAPDVQTSSMRTAPRPTWPTVLKAGGLRPSRALMAYRGHHNEDTNAVWTGRPLDFESSRASARAGSMPNRSLLSRALGRGTRTAADAGRSGCMKAASTASASTTPWYLSRCTNRRAAPRWLSPPATRSPLASRRRGPAVSSALHPGTRVAPGSTPRRRDIDMMRTYAAHATCQRGGEPGWYFRGCHPNLLVGCLSQAISQLSVSSNDRQEAARPGSGLSPTSLPATIPGTGSVRPSEPPGPRPSQRASSRQPGRPDPWAIRRPRSRAVARC